MAKYGKAASKNVKSSERRVEEREVHDAPPQEGHPQERVRTNREKPQAGDRDRPQRGTQEGREGPSQILRQPKALRKKERPLR